MLVKKIIQSSIHTKQQILNDSSFINQIEDISEICIKAFYNNKKIILAGNGGSAADSQHICAEFVSKFNHERQSIPSLALTTDTSILTSIGNDFGFDKLFSRQIEGNGNSGDIFIAISTSGNSLNIINALKVANKKNITTIGLTGKSGGKMLNLCDHCIKVPSTDTARIQESHIMIGHIICTIVENEIVKGKL